MSSLPLVIDVVDLVDEASERGHTLNVDEEAQRLLERHPEADASRKEIVALIQAEEEAAGQLPKPSQEG